MAQKSRRSRKRENGFELKVPQLKFTSKNYMFFGIGLLIIILGYITLPLSKDGWISLTLSPILLISGYCIFIPLGILYKRANSGE